MNKINLFCPSCKSKAIIKTGKRVNKYQQIQRYRCKGCNKNFTDKKIIQKTYSSQVILNSLSYYNLGYTQQQTSKLISKKYKVNVPQKTISNWLNEYKNICTFQKLRKEAKKLYPAEEIIKQHTLMHNNLPYQFQIHQAKLYLLFHNILYNNQFHNISRFYEPVEGYLNKIPTKFYPHHIFKEHEKISKKFSVSRKLQSNFPGYQNPTAEVAKNKNLINEKNPLEQRASQLKLQTLKIKKLTKNNLTNKLTKLALNLAKNNNQRHEAIQNFMITNDSTTIACEVPVYLTNDDIKYFQNKGFKLNLENYETPITGHIDILQIRNGLIHILDYKPDADKISPIEQLTIYALALASRTKLALSNFKASWFDENNYYEFFPLHAVYEKQNV